MNAKHWLGGVALMIAAPALAGVKDGVDAWSRGDYARAVVEWQGPAASGDADAQFNLAQAYKLGKGVSADLKRAEALYSQAAKQGHLPAADNYGLILFQTGRREQAMAWLVPAAERGEPRAQYVLGIAHFNGDLLPQDQVRGYALMSRAAASGLDTAKATLATMDSSLSLEQRQQGVALAAELDAKAAAMRSAQVAAVGLGGKPAVVLPRKVTTPKGVVATKPAPVTAGADYANPVALTAKAPPPPMKAPPPVAKTPTPAAAHGNWRVQLGAFGVAGNAQALWSKLRGSAAFTGRQPFYVSAGKLTKLQAGPFATRAEAQAACAKAGQACMPVEG